MFRNGELGPNINPDPDFINSPLPVFINNPDPIELPFGHGERYKPSPTAFTLPAIPSLLMYKTPDPLILSTILDAAVEPIPAIAPVARLGSILDRRNLPAVARNGRIAPMNPPSTLALCAICVLLILIVTPFPFSYAFAILLICARVRANTCSPDRSSCDSLILTPSHPASSARLILSFCPSDILTFKFVYRLILYITRSTFLIILTLL